jgi:hypothetical protein
LQHAVDRANSAIREFWEAIPSDRSPAAEEWLLHDRLIEAWNEAWNEATVALGQARDPEAEPAPALVLTA